MIELFHSSYCGLIVEDEADQRNIEQQEDAADRHDGEQRDLARGLLLRFELPDVLEEVALWQRDFPVDRRAHVADYAAKITAGDVGLNDDAALDVLAVDRVRPLIRAHFGDLADRDFSARRRV